MFIKINDNIGFKKVEHLTDVLGIVEFQDNKKEQVLLQAKINEKTDKYRARLKEKVPDNDSVSIDLAKSNDSLLRKYLSEISELSNELEALNNVKTGRIKYRYTLATSKGEVIYHTPHFIKGSEEEKKFLTRVGIDPEDDYSISENDDSSATMAE